MALRFFSNGKDAVLEALRKGEVDTAEVSFTGLIDEIVIRIKKLKLIEKLSEVLGDKRRDNAKIPFDALLTLFIAAKMKVHTSLTDVPYAITDASALAEIGWNMAGSGRRLSEGLMTEGAVRNTVGKYSADELVSGYNTYVQKPVNETMDLSADIHILDCTWLEVEINNANYEKSEITKEDGVSARGYKLATLRGVIGDTGIIEEIKIGGIKTHDLALSDEMVRQSEVFKNGDVLINDRGFISRDLINFMKVKRGVDTYIPLKKNMEAFEMAVSTAVLENKWFQHPNKKRKKQQIAYVGNLGAYWRSENPEDDVELCACVVWDKAATGADDKYRVFVTTDTTAKARQIIKTYEIRPEIEEDYRQIKEFWKIEDFKSTKYSFIVFHVVMVLVGYLYYQLFRLLPEGKPYVGKCLPVALKKYVPEGPRSVICYAGSHFGIFEFLEFLDIYAELDAAVKARLRPVLAMI